MNQNSAPQVPGVMLYRHFYDALSSLDHATVGRLTVALMEYAFFDVEPTLSPELEIAWAFMKNYVDRDGARYALKVAHRRAAAEKRWEKGEGTKAPPSPPLASTSGGGGRAAARSEGACAGPEKAPPVSPAASQPPQRWGQETHPPLPKKEQQPFGNIEWMENHVYRDEKGVIRYR